MALRNTILGIAGAASVLYAAYAFMPSQPHYDNVYVGTVHIRSPSEREYRVIITDETISQKKHHFILHNDPSQSLAGKPIRHISLQSLSPQSLDSLPQSVSAIDSGIDGTIEVCSSNYSNRDEGCGWSSIEKVSPCSDTDRAKLEKLLSTAVEAVANPDHAVKHD